MSLVDCQTLSLVAIPGILDVFFVDTLSSSLDNVVVLWHILGDVLFFRGIIDVQFHNLQLFT